MSKYLLFLSLFAGFIMAPFVGEAPITLAGLFDPNSLEFRIFTELRLPRIFLAFFTGLILALGGLIFQTLFRNALMTPYTLGVSSGAVLGAGIAIKLGLAVSFLGINTTVLFGSTGALLTVVLLLFLARFLHKAEHESLLLLGIALSFFYTSALTVLFFLSSYVETHQILRFTMGSLSIIGFDTALIAFVLALVLFTYIYFQRFALQIISISDEQARLKGINTKKALYSLLGISSVAVGIMVSIVGPIGFVGLVVPHMVKKIYQKSLITLITPIALFGGFFLLACDTLSRAISSGSEIPIGVVTAFIGGPFFIYLILTRKKH
ncbi:MAG: iron ABC transporter permease [Thiovulaceae bacterium]|nr:iron ABC transporter permease [Sulfurimonadaceae bacterium]